MTPKLLLGIDVGTSKVKTNLFDLQGNMLRELSAGVVLLTPAHGQAEIDLNDLRRNLIKVVREIAAGHEGDIAGIGFSVSSPTLVLLDRDLEAVRPGIAYLDNRSVNELEKAVAEFGGKAEYFARVGNNPSPSTCVAATINWVKANEPDNWARTHKIGFLNTYLAAQLTGQAAVDPTVASFSGLVDVKTPDRWDSGLLERFAIAPGLLPEIVPSYTRVGELNKKMADSLGLPAGIPVALGGADTAVTSFALGLREHGDAFLSMGTSEVLTFCLTTPSLNPAFLNRSHVIPGQWLAHGAMSTAGAAIGWLLKNVFPEYGSEMELEREAVSSPLGANGLVFVPYLCGERSPIFDPRASGLFFGLSLTTRRSDIVRAVFEGVAYGMRQIYTIGREQWGVKPEFIKCVGGGSKSALAVKLRADALEAEFRTIESDSTAAYGAALLGGLAAGIFPAVDKVPYLNAYGKHFSPQAESAAHFSKYCTTYNRLYPSLKELMELHYNFIVPGQQ